MDTRGRVCSPEWLATTNILADDPAAAPLDCNVLYKYRYRAKYGVAHRLSLSGGAVEPRRLRQLRFFWQAGCLFSIAWTSNDSFARHVAMPNSAWRLSRLRS